MSKSNNFGKNTSDDDIRRANSSAKKRKKELHERDLIDEDEDEFSGISSTDLKRLYE